jgi:uncharacterized protein (TIGR02246 family)
MKPMQVLLLALLGILTCVAQTRTPVPAAPAQRTPAPSSPPVTDEAQIRELYDNWAKAFRAHDVEGIMAVYAPGKTLVAYDVVPPLQYVGREAYRKDYEEFLAQYQGPIEVEYRDLRIIADDRVAFVHALERMSGTLKNGQKLDFWLRATSGLQKIHSKWLIVHDHISVPANFETGKAVLDLKP